MLYVLHMYLHEYNGIEKYLDFGDYSYRPVGRRYQILGRHTLNGTQILGGHTFNGTQILGGHVPPLFLQAQAIRWYSKTLLKLLVFIFSSQRALFAFLTLKASKIPATLKFWSNLTWKIFSWSKCKVPLILLCRIISVECPTNSECTLVCCHLKLVWSLNFEIVL